MNLCRCEHAEDKHRSRKYVDAAPGPCTQCDCKKYTAKSAMDWVRIARLAEHVRRYGNSISMGRRPNDVVLTVTNHWSHKPEIPCDEPHDSDEAVQLCEMLGSSILEHAQELSNGRTPTLSWKPPQVRCMTCSQTIGVACIPMHDGERSPGGWSHPVRLMSSGGEQTSGVIEWARAWKQGDRRDALPGVPLAGSWMEERADDGMYPELRAGIDHVVDEILSLVYQVDQVTTTMGVDGVARFCEAINDDGVRCQRAEGHGSLHRAKTSTKMVEWRGQPVIRRDPIAVDTKPWTIPPPTDERSNLQKTRDRMIESYKAIGSPSKKGPTP